MNRKPVIETPIGNMEMQNMQAPRRFVVDDPTDPGIEHASFISNEEYQQPPQQRAIDPIKKIEENRKAKNTILPENKNKLEILLGIKQKKRSIQIDGHSIILKSLSGKETKIALVKVSDIQNNVEQVFDIRHIMLACSLYSIDGEIISDLLGSYDDIDTRISLVEEMSDDAINELYSFYQNEISNEQPKTIAESKEVASEIKK